MTYPIPPGLVAGETLEKKRDLGHDHKYST